MQEEVSEQRGNRAALRCSHSPVPQGTIGHQHRGFQPALHVDQDPFRVRVMRDRLLRQIPGHRVEERPDVHVDYPVVPETPFPAYRDRVQSRASWPVPIGVVVEHFLQVRLQRQYRHRLRDPVDDIGNAENSRASFLWYLHRADRAGEIRSRRHAVPQLVQAAPQVSPEPLDRHAVGPGRSPVFLHLQPCIPHEPFRDIVRLALQHRFSHVVHSFRLATFINQSDPAPWLRPHYRVSQLLRASPPACLVTGTQPLTVSAAWSSPSRRHPWRQFRGDTFTRSIREPRPGSCCLYAGHHLGSKRVNPQIPPGTRSRPRFRCRLNGFRRVNDRYLQPSSRTTPDALMARLFLRRSPRTAVNGRSAQWFGTAPRRAIPEGHTTSITRTAPQSADPPSFTRATSCVRVHKHPHHHAQSRSSPSRSRRAHAR